MCYEFNNKGTMIPGSKVESRDVNWLAYLSIKSYPAEQNNGVCPVIDNSLKISIRCHHQ